jgi:hypothetical protein
MRTKYETDNDRQWQELARQKIAGRLFLLYGDSNIKTTASLKKHDFDIDVGDYTAIVEYKRRTHRYGRYPDVTMSESKWKYMRSHPKDAYFAFDYEDGLYMANAKAIPELLAAMGGRTRNVRDAYDIHMCVQIPLVHLVKLNWWKPF